MCVRGSNVYKYVYPQISEHNVVTEKWRQVLSAPKTMQQYLVNQRLKRDMRSNGKY